MDDKTAFVELSALLTGLYDLTKDSPEKTLEAPAADEYLRLLKGSFSDRVTKLLDAYRTLAAVMPKPAIDDALLAKFKATPEFNDKNIEFVARQVVNIWYFSQYREVPDGVFVDGGFYERGFAWPLIKAHPIGFSNQPHGYWTDKP
jgi:hypothetical protein